MKTIITVIMVCFYTMLFSQSEIMRILDSDPRISTTLRSNNVYDPNKTDNTISGSPYITDNYIAGNISKVNVNIAFKYNAYKDLIQFKDGEKIYDLPKDQLYSPIVLNDKTKITLENENDGSLHYYTELYQNNDLALLKKQNINLIEGKTSDGYREATNARFSAPKIDYFLKIGKNIIPYPKNKKELLKMFPNKNLDAFFKQNSSYYKDEKLLIKLTQLLSEN